MGKISWTERKTTRRSLQHTDITADHTKQETTILRPHKKTYHNMHRHITGKVREEGYLAWQEDLKDWTGLPLRECNKIGKEQDRVAAIQR